MRHLPCAGPQINNIPIFNASHYLITRVPVKRIALCGAHCVKVGREPLGYINAIAFFEAKPGPRIVPGPTICWIRAPTLIVAANDQRDSHYLPALTRRQHWRSERRSTGVVKSSGCRELCGLDGVILGEDEDLARDFGGHAVLQCCESKHDVSRRWVDVFYFWWRRRDFHVFVCRV